MNEENQQKKESFFKKFHNDGFTWHDNIFIVALVMIAITILGQSLGYCVVVPLQKINPALEQDGYLSLLLMYLVTIGVWILFLLYCRFTKYNRPILKAITPLAKGNNIKMLLFGFLIGFAENAIGILFACLHSDIHLVFDSIQIIKLILIFIAIFCQSSSEEICCRAFAYQRLRKGYKSPWVAIIGNAVIFMALHLFNPGVSIVPILHLVVIAVFYSLFVYYFDSIWLPMAAHAAWNFTQNIIFGLPNSGIVSTFSVMKLDASLGQLTFFYDPVFGVEGSAFLLIFSIVLMIAVIVIGEKKGARSLNIWE